MASVSVTGMGGVAAYLASDLAGANLSEELLELSWVHLVGDVADEKTHV
jgi:hypothetical protein